MKYNEIRMKDSEDVYYIPKLNVRDTREVVTKCLSVLAPVIGDGIDSYQEYESERIRAYVSSDDDSVDIAADADPKLFSVFAILGTQLENPQVVEIQDLLLKGAKVSTKGQVSVENIPSLPNYNIDEAYDFKTYLKILKVSFERNALVPFVECLNEVGYSEIVGKVQAAVVNKLHNPT